VRILFLTDSEPDFGEALLWQGLRDAIGHENLYDYPIKPQFHAGFMEQAPFGPFGWMQDGTPSAWWNKTSLEHCEDGIALDFYDSIVCGSARPVPLGILLRFQEQARGRGIPCILYDGWDHDRIDEKALRLCDIYLKREMKGPSNNPKVKHYPFSIPDALYKSAQQFQWDRERAKIDVLFAMGNSHPKRKQMYYSIKEWQASGKAKLKWECRLLGEVDPALPYPEYLALMDDAKYAISMAGGGEDTVRFWEILGRTGLIHDYPNLSVVQAHCNFFGIGFDALKGHEMTPESIENQIVNYHANAEAFVAEGNRGSYRHKASYRACAVVEMIEEWKGNRDGKPL
jgi:hypothetical protein